MMSETAALYCDSLPTHLLMLHVVCIHVAQYCCCVDRASAIDALARTDIPLPMQPTQREVRKFNLLPLS